MNGIELKTLLKKNGLDVTKLRINTVGNTIRVKLLDYDLDKSKIIELLKPFNTVENISDDWDNICVGTSVTVEYSAKPSFEMIEAINLAMSKHEGFSIKSFNDVHHVANSLVEKYPEKHLSCYDWKDLIHRSHP